MILYKPLTRFRKTREVRESYRQALGRQLNLKNPRTFNEKIQWLKLNYRDYRMNIGADKATAKGMVSELVGDKYVIPTIGIYDRSEDINWEGLPEKFVAKITDGYNQNIICTDKATFDTGEATEMLNNWLKPASRIYWRKGSYQSQYKNTRPRILIENFIGDGVSRILEYKFMYLSGKLAFIVAESRPLENALEFNQTLFDTEWNRLDVVRVGYPPSESDIPKPKSLPEMLRLAKKIAQDFPVCRVDFYEVNNKPLVGELTFTPADGGGVYSPDSWDMELGDMIELPQRNNFTLLEWEPIEIDIKRVSGSMKMKVRKFVKMVLPYRVRLALREYREMNSETRQPAEEKSISINFIGAMSDSEALSVLKKQGSGIHFGQSAEDAVLTRIFKGKKNGFYVDIGAFHPTVYSNTYLLNEFLGWTGINIDASSRAIELFKKARPNDVNIQVAVGAKKGKKKLHVFSSPARNTLSPDNVLRQKKKGDVKIVGEEVVSVRRLADILDEYMPATAEIDIMDIDIEGYDIQALKTNNWEKYRPKVILIEDYAINTQGFEKSEVYKFMNSLNYRFFSHTYDTSIYVDINQNFTA